MTVLARARATPPPPGPPPPGSRTTTLGVVGLGYAGLPLAKLASDAGLDVVGFDLDPGRVAVLASGRSYVTDLADHDVATMLDRGAAFATDPEVLRTANAVLISVPTPLAADGATPDLSYVESAGRSVARILAPGTVVILESTSHPGTTEEVLRPVLEQSGLTAGRDFHLAFSPERMSPGGGGPGLANRGRIVAGLTPACRERAAAVLGVFCEGLTLATGLREAEMAKLIENSHRQVNIALVNELLVLSEHLGVDVWEALRLAATKPFGYEAYRPGPGVGGHCIPVDPLYLVAAARAVGVGLRLIPAAQEINDAMPDLVADRVRRLLPPGGPGRRRVLLLGLSYKPDVADDRGSPARAVAGRLRADGYALEFHDPSYATWSGAAPDEPVVTDLPAAVSRADLVVLLQAHTAYLDGPWPARAAQVLDTRGVLPRSDRVVRL